MRRPVILIAMVLLGLSATRCGDDAADRRAAEVASIRRVWSAHERTVRDAVAAGREQRYFDQEELLKALGFFERTTGLRTTVPHSYVGTLPTNAALRDLDRWNAWYETNSSRLYLDAEGVVRVHPTTPATMPSEPHSK